MLNNFNVVAEKVDAWTCARNDTDCYMNAFHVR